MALGLAEELFLGLLYGFLWHNWSGLEEVGRLSGLLRGSGYCEARSWRRHLDNGLRSSLLEAGSWRRNIDDWLNDRLCLSNWLWFRNLLLDLPH